MHAGFARAPCMQPARTVQLGASTLYLFFRSSPVRKSEKSGPEASKRVRALPDPAATRSIPCASFSRILASVSGDAELGAGCRASDAREGCGAGACPPPQPAASDDEARPRSDPSIPALIASASARMLLLACCMARNGMILQPTLHTIRRRRADRCPTPRGSAAVAQTETAVCSQRAGGNGQVRLHAHV